MAVKFKVETARNVLDTIREQPWVRRHHGTDLTSKGGYQTRARLGKVVSTIMPCTTLHGDIVPSTGMVQTMRPDATDVLSRISGETDAVTYPVLNITHTRYNAGDIVIVISDVCNRYYIVGGNSCVLTGTLDESITGPMTITDAAITLDEISRTTDMSAVTARVVVPEDVTLEADTPGACVKHVSGDWVFVPFGRKVIGPGPEYCIVSHCVPRIDGSMVCNVQRTDQDKHYGWYEGVYHVPNIYWDYDTVFAGRIAAAMAGTVIGGPAVARYHDLDYIDGNSVTRSWICNPCDVVLPDCPISGTYHAMGGHWTSHDGYICSNGIITDGRVYPYINGIAPTYDSINGYVHWGNIWVSQTMGLVESVPVGKEPWEESVTENNETTYHGTDTWGPRPGNSGDTSSSGNWTVAGQPEGDTLTLYARGSNRTDTNNRTRTYAITYPHWILDTSLPNDGTHGVYKPVDFEGNDREDDNIIFGLPTWLANGDEDDKFEASEITTDEFTRLVGDYHVVIAEDGHDEETCPHTYRGYSCDHWRKVHAWIGIAKATIGGSDVWILGTRGDSVRGWFEGSAPELGETTHYTHHHTDLPTLGYSFCDLLQNKGRYLSGGDYINGDAIAAVTGPTPLRTLRPELQTIEANPRNDYLSEGESPTLTVASLSIGDPRMDILYWEATSGFDTMVTLEFEVPHKPAYRLSLDMLARSKYAEWDVASGVWTETGIPATFLATHIYQESTDAHPARWYRDNYAGVSWWAGTNLTSARQEITLTNTYPTKPPKVHSWGDRVQYRWSVNWWTDTDDDYDRVFVDTEAGVAYIPDATDGSSRWETPIANLRQQATFKYQPPSADCNLTLPDINSTLERNLQSRYPWDGHSITYTGGQYIIGSLSSGVGYYRCTTPEILDAEITWTYRTYPKSDVSLSLHQYMLDGGIAYRTDDGVRTHLGTLRYNPTHDVWCLGEYGSGDGWYQTTTRPDSVLEMTFDHIHPAARTTHMGQYIRDGRKLVGRNASGEIIDQYGEITTPYDTTTSSYRYVNGTDGSDTGWYEILDAADRATMDVVVPFPYVCRPLAAVAVSHYGYDGGTVRTFKGLVTAFVEWEA